MTGLLKSANLALAFLLELTALGAFAYWGILTGETALSQIVLGLGTPVLGTVLWGIFAAPQSPRRLQGTAYHIFRVAFFVLATLALIAAGSVILGLAFGAVFVVNTVLILAWHQ